MRRNTTTGIYLALATAVISGISIYLNKFAVTAVGDVLFFTTLKNTLVGVFMSLYLTFTLRHFRFARISAQSWLGLIGIAVIGGSIPFLLFFKGLSQTQAASATLIHKSLFLWVALLAIPLLGERPRGWGLLGLTLLTVSQLLNSWPQTWGWGSGETMILFATLFWAAETIVVKLLLPAIPISVAATARMTGGAAVMWAYLLLSSQAGSVLELSGTQWAWIILTAALLLAYVSTWYAALRLAPATIVTSVLPLGAIITTMISLFAEGKAVAGIQAWSSIGMLLGAAILAFHGMRISSALRQPGTRVGQPG